MQRCPSVLEVMRNYITGVVTVRVQFCNKLDEKQYYIPFTYTTGSNPNFIITWKNIWLTSWHSKIQISLEKNEWIIFNLQQAGKYSIKNLYLYYLFILYILSSIYISVHMSRL